MIELLLSTGHLAARKSIAEYMSVPEAPLTEKVRVSEAQLDTL